MSGLGRFLRRLQRAWRGPSQPAGTGAATRVLDGNEAVALAARTAGAPARAFGAGSPRGDLAAALGQALAGVRTTALLSGQDLAACDDLLALAAGRRVPLVAHLVCRARAAHAIASGTGHAAWHAAADCGWAMLFARNVQEAVDLGLVARRAAETALVPCLVAMDDEATACAAQDVALPDAALAARCLGAADDAIACPTPAQSMLFGRERRRVPRFFDLDRPVQLGPRAGPEWALGAVARRPYLEYHVVAALRAAFEALAAETGRPLGPLSRHRVDGAQVVLIAQGSAVEVLESVADRLRARERLDVGVLGVRCLRPFPAGELRDALRGCRAAVTIERADAPLGGVPPLLRELQAALGERDGRRDRPAPRLHAAVAGLGGAPLRAADLEALCRAVLADGARPVGYLGVDFAPARSAHPKRQVLLDRLRRSYPDASDLGLSADPGAPGPRAEGAVAVAFRRAGSDDALGSEAAQLLGALFGGRVRSRTGRTGGFGEVVVDLVFAGGDALREPGDDALIDVLVCAHVGTPADVAGLDALAPGGAVLCSGDPARLPARVRRALRDGERDLCLYAVRAAPAGDEPGHPAETLLGALAGTLIDRGAGFTASRAAAARADALRKLPDGERNGRLAAFEGGLAEVRPVARAELPEPAPDDAPDDAREVPASLLPLARSDQAFDSLPRFWDQVGVLYERGEAGELCPDPYLALGVVPPRSAALCDVGAAADTLPELDPTVCTGCGACWTSCPDGAVGPVAIGPAALCDAGIGEAKRQGRDADALRMLQQKLQARLGQAMRGEAPPATLGEALAAAFEPLARGLPDGRREPLQHACTALQDTIGALPVVRTAPLFDEPEAAVPGSGELLSLAFDPDACKGCGICIAVCEPGALAALPRSRARVDAARAGWRLRDRLPDTGGATIARLREHVDFDGAAALLMARPCLQALAGGDGAEPGSGEKLALRTILAAVEYHLGPLLQRRLAEIEALRGRFAEAIRQLLASALPTDDLDALADGLAALGRHDVDLGALQGKMTGAVDRGSIDAGYLGRLIDTARRLADLAFRLAHGRDGHGRARAGLVIADSSVAAWAGAFPRNPFAQPVLVDSTDESAALARGLIEGTVATVLDDVRLLRQARLELERPPAEAAHAAAALGRLAWSDLDADERALCPPLLIVRGAGARGVARLEGLCCDLPVVTVALAPLGLGLDEGTDGALDPEPDLALVAIAHRSAFVLQSSIARPAHLVDGVLAALRCGGPALVHVHAPSPERHGFPADRTLRQARLAVDSRAFSLLRYDPTADGVFGARLELAPAPDGRTPADWAVTEGRFARHFAPLGADQPAPVPLRDHLALPLAERDGTPFVAVADPDGGGDGGGGGGEQRLGVSAQLVARCDEQLARWRTLQELAGEVTPFTERVRADAERAVRQQHEAELHELRAAHEARVAGLGAEIEQQLEERLQRKLLALARKAQAAAASPAGGTP